MGRVKRLVMFGLAAYVVALGALTMLQRSLIYRPAGGYVTPGAVGLGDVAELVIHTPDKQRIVVWYAPPRPRQPVLLYFHGNGGNLAGRADRITRFREQGWGVMMMSWRGFSGSTGSPSEAANIADAKLAYDRLTRLGIGPERIVVYGESLGTGVAVRTAADRKVAGLVLEAPFTSAADVARLRYPMFPVELLMWDQYRSDRVIGGVEAPILILHGEKDSVVPVEFGKRLAALAPEPKQLVLFAEGEHLNLPAIGGVEALRDWLAHRGLPRLASAEPPDAKTPPVKTSGVWDFQVR